MSLEFQTLLFCNSERFVCRCQGGGGGGGGGLSTTTPHLVRNFTDFSFRSSSFHFTNVAALTPCGSLKFALTGLQCRGWARILVMD